ncbi:Sarcosine oxidase, gamma subunit family [Vibrio aerogenes CECT 7868]|uniref:Sarcosine oxidase, gamma subunit family n=1 Tax=Vibrio aerogenes CECT 7868 TaxID=1216006 RepID=A0A1M6BV09_9VIBR|nr:hypothetical protein [Vibrio aerogenes]SHI52531.1 Sarcosine oxidase, gamma subunit family [Vibrio aerogenes CECT 7868]
MEYFNLSAAPELRKSLIAETSPVNGAINCQDVTTYSRVGIRGEQAGAFLAEQNLPVPSQPNQAARADDLIVLRLSQKEFWVIDLSHTNHSVLANLELLVLNTKGLYRLYCQHSHMMMLINGLSVHRMFAKVCGVDLSEKVFPAGAIAQTSVARTNAVVVRLASGDQEQFLLLADISSAQYLWEAIADAAMEFNSIALNQ